MPKVQMVAAIAVCTGFIASAQDTLLYDVDFSSPLHTVGQVPTEGFGAAPRRTPTAHLGSPRVRSSVGLLTNQPCELTPVGTAENVHYQITGPTGFAEYPAYRVKFDLVIVEGGRPFGGGFVLIADVPTVRTIWWRWDGTIQGFGAGPTWTEGELQRVETLWDVEANTCSMWINGAFIGTNVFEANSIQKFRTASGTNSNQPGPETVAAFDNLKIWGVPAPSTAIVLVFAAAVSASRRRPKV